MAHSTDPRRCLLGITPSQQPPDDYRLLGLARLELNPDVIDHAAERQLDHLQRHRTADNADEVAELCDQIVNARDCLLDHDAHLAYAGKLQGYQSDSEDLDLQAAWRMFSDEFDESWRTARRSEPDPQHLWLGIPRHQRPASNERLLGVDERERDAAVIRSAAERQIGFVRRFASGEKAEQANLLLGQLSRARSMLLRSVADAAEPAELDRADDVFQNRRGLPDADFIPSIDETVPFDAGEMLDMPSPVSHPVTAPPTHPASSSTVPAPVAKPMATRGRIQPSSTKLIGAIAGVVLLALVGWAGYKAISLDQDSTTPVPRDQNRSGQNRSGPYVSRPSRQRPTPPSIPSSRPSGQQPSTEVERFIERARRMPPMELDLDEIERYAAMATTDSERAGIDALRIRCATWKNHLERIDDARFLGKLIGVENSIAHIERQMQRDATGDDDLNKVLDHLNDLKGMPHEFPHHTNAVKTRHAEVEASAVKLVDDLKKLAATGPASEASTVRAETDDGDNPFVIDSQTPAMVEPPADPRGAPAVEVPEAPTSRKWTTTGGSTFDAMIEKIDQERVMFRRVSDDRKASMAIDQLSDPDQAILRGVYFDREDAKQYDEVAALVNTIASDPESAMEDLKASHLEHSDSPYAGLWSSVCLSEGRNRSEEASRLLLNVVRRIEEQQKLSGGERHAMTLAATCNNLAVCKIKEGEVDAAAIQLARALEATPKPLIVAVQNAQQLLRRTPTGRPLKSSSRTKLEKALEGLESVATVLPSGWLYSLDANVPASSVHGRSGYLFVHQTVPGNPIVRNQWCLVCKGGGTTPCDYGNCLRGTIVVKQRVQVAVNQLTGEPIYGDKNFKQTCPNCRGEGSFDCRNCDDGRIP